jgi:thiol:disulfide interchange protein DsbD
LPKLKLWIPLTKERVISMKKKLFILILLLCAWNCSAEVTLSSQTFENDASNFPPVENDASNFPPIENDASNFPRFENGADRFSPPAGADSFSPFENGAFKFPSPKEGGLGGISEVLPPDVAFVFSTHLESPTVLVAQWQIADGYYLYRDQFQFALKGGGVLGEAQFPPGTIKDDVKYGRVEVYEHVLNVKLPVQDSQGLDILTLETRYQGCAADRMCYPPIEKTAQVSLPNTAPSVQVAAADNPIIQENQSNSGLSSTPSDTPDTHRGELSTPSEASDKKSPEATTLNDLGDAAERVGNANKFLKVDDAFVFSAEWKNPSSLVVRWKIADGYYLFQDKLKFSLESGGKLGAPQLPPSLVKNDPILGDRQIYQQPLLEIMVPIQANGQQNVSLSVEYQGCAVAGLCYPAITKVVDLQLGKGGAMSEQDRLANMLASANLWYTLMVFFGLGLLLSLTPCVFPMIPILSSIIVGQGKQVTTYKAFIMSLTYVLAMALTYAVVGVLTGLLGENIQAAFQNPWVLISFALVFVALAFSMFGFYELQMPSALQTKLTALSNRQQGGTLIGVAIMGVLSALIVGPCVAAPLVGALIYIGQTGDALLGGLALFFMSLGMGIPLILVGISAGHLLPKAAQWMDSVKAIFGVMLLAVALWMLERIIPGEVTMLLWASLLIVSAVYMGALESLPAGVSGWRKLWKGLGLIFMVYGILLMIGAASGNVNPLQPLHNLRLGNHSTAAASSAESASQFKPIKGVDGLERELAAAKAQNKPVMLEFYADWCISCKEMENFTFTDAGVQELFTNFVLLQADVTPHDEHDKALYKRFGIFGPPAILFFDTNGQEQRAYRIVGFMPAEEFRQHLKKVIQP